jgi:hypothetical protein
MPSAALIRRRDPLVLVRQKVRSAPQVDLDAVGNRSYPSPPELETRLFGRPVRSTV